MRLPLRPRKDRVTRRITLVGFLALVTTAIEPPAHAQWEKPLPQHPHPAQGDKAAAAVPATQVSVHDTAGLRAAVSAWVQAWEAQDVGRYFEAYAPGFRPPHGQSREVWKTLRGMRVSRPSKVQVSISDMEVLRRTENRAEIAFRQDYRSDRYQDSVRKTMELVRDRERWLIAEERVVATLAGPGAAPDSARATTRPDEEKSAGGVPIAQVEAGASDAAAVGATGVPAGPLTAFPGVDLAVGYDDNLLRAPTGQISTPVTVIAPYLTLEARSGPHRFDIRYRGAFGRYSDSHSDDYNDNAVQANAEWTFTARSDLTARLEYIHGHDARGSTDRPLSTTPDRYWQAGGSALYGYGASGAKGRVELDGNYFQRRYTNNRQNTALSDRDVGSLGATFFWRVAPKTRLLFQGRYIDFDYVDPASTQDSSDRYLYLGAHWEATAKTTGTVKYGYSRKVFRSPGNPTQSGSSWDLAVRWSPRTYSAFDFTTYRRFEESTGVGDAILQSQIGARWTHAWNSRLSHSLGYAYYNDKYKGNTNRDDNTNAIGLRIDYRMRRWLKFGAEYLYTDRDSNESQYRYRRNVIMFSVGATL